MSERVEITFDRDTLEEFKEKWRYASLDNLHEFEFRGHTFNTAFAKYLIEYLEPVIEILDRNPFTYPQKRVN